jgi:hypothetical protein
MLRYADGVDMNEQRGSAPGLPSRNPAVRAEFDYDAQWAPRRERVRIVTMDEPAEGGPAERNDRPSVGRILVDPVAADAHLGGRRRDCEGASTGTGSGSTRHRCSHGRSCHPSSIASRAQHRLTGPVRARGPASFSADLPEPVNGQILSAAAASRLAAWAASLTGTCGGPEPKSAARAGRAVLNTRRRDERPAPPSSVPAPNSSA